MNQSEMRVVKGPTLRNKIETIVGVMPAETLVLHHYVPHRNVLKDAGYQRNPSAPRITRLAGDLKRGDVDLPTSVLLNLRVENSADVLTLADNDRYDLVLDPDKSEDEHRLFVVDGQHRIRALQKAIDEYEVDLRHVNIPFVCMLGANELQEMEQFHVVNSNAKSVPTDLALDLLKARAHHDPEFAAWIGERGRAWQVSAQALTEYLATSSNTWKHRIRLPNTPKVDTTVPSGSFVRSLKILLTQTAIFRSLKDTERQAQVIDAYWRAIRRVLPEAFEEPLQYNIQKGVGVEVLHSVFPIVLDLARGTGGSIFNADSYVPLIDRALNAIEGPNGEGTPVRGEAFWLTGRRGAAGAYTSAAGKRRLAEYLQSELPELDL